GAQGEGAQLQRPQHRRTARQQHLAAKRRNSGTAPRGATRATSGKARQRSRMARAAWAEDLVAAWYVRNGYVIVARNWRCPRGELDIVALRDGVLAICEVKARRNANFGDPFEAITPQKMLRVRRATAAFLLTHKQTVNQIRFDFAAVLGVRLEVRCGVA
ncbi:MAG: YraN family protein, partial [Ilumatobacteraceae bacterium]